MHNDFGKNTLPLGWLLLRHAADLVMTGWPVHNDFGKNTLPLGWLLLRHAADLVMTGWPVRLLPEEYDSGWFRQAAGVDGIQRSAGPS